MKSIPAFLIFSRLLFGLTIIILSIFKIDRYKTLVVTFLTIGLITDIFDGIIARQLKVSTEKLRRWDSSVDQIFWSCALIGSFLISKDFFISNLYKIAIILIFEGSTYIISFIKFRKEVATHAILSKIWTITILITLVEIIAFSKADLLFNICFYLGIISRIEIIGILLLLKKWTNDVPSLYHAILLRNGKSIKRNKLFNG